MEAALLPLMKPEGVLAKAGFELHEIKHRFRTSNPKHPGWVCAPTCWTRGPYRSRRFFLAQPAATVRNRRTVLAGRGVGGVWLTLGCTRAFAACSGSAVRHYTGARRTGAARLGTPYTVSSVQRNSNQQCLPARHAQCLRYATSCTASSPKARPTPNRVLSHMSSCCLGLLRMGQAGLAATATCCPGNCHTLASLIDSRELPYVYQRSHCSCYTRRNPNEPHVSPLHLPPTGSGAAVS